MNSATSMAVLSLGLVKVIDDSCLVTGEFVALMRFFCVELSCNHSLASCSVKASVCTLRMQSKARQVGMARGIYIDLPL